MDEDEDEDVDQACCRYVFVVTGVSKLLPVSG